MTTAFDFESQKPKLAHLRSQLGTITSEGSPVKIAKQRVELLANADVYRWFVPQEYGGFAWNAIQQVQGYLELSSACLSSAFVLTQRTAAVNRIAASSNDSLKNKVLQQRAEGKLFSTVGISHLTTSHRHLEKPVLVAEKVDGGYQLNGFSPWVTGVSFADSVVIGATCDNGSEILIYASTDLPGVTRPPTPKLVALSDSCTGEIRFNDTFVEDNCLIAGPQPAIMSQGAGGNTGGLQTSTLAIGLAKSAIEFIEQENQFRSGFQLPAEHLRDQFEAALEYLMAVASGNDNCSNEQLRTLANSLALRSTQAALMVAKGVGFKDNHSVGRWCREALFFLVWSCPQPVAESNLCELAQISD
ncbi:MAG: acyl-CoA dehydrogenase family protein [Planctomycetota bacterium]|nr:acyl-CoA dehydrogenase family protein [Planctomycetota bacterium]